MKAAATLQNFTHKRQGELDGWQEQLQKEQDDLRKQAERLSRRGLQRRFPCFLQLRWWFRWYPFQW